MTDERTITIRESEDGQVVARDDPTGVEARAATVSLALSLLSEKFEVRAERLGVGAFSR